MFTKFMIEFRNLFNIFCMNINVRRVKNLIFSFINCTKNNLFLIAQYVINIYNFESNKN